MVLTEAEALDTDYSECRRFPKELLPGSAPDRPSTTRTPPVPGLPIYYLAGNYFDSSSYLATGLYFDPTYPFYFTIVVDLFL